MQSMTRRTFLRSAGAVAGSAAVVGLGSPVASASTSERLDFGVVSRNLAPGRVEVVLDNGRADTYDFELPHRELQPGDRVVVPARSDVAVPLFLESAGVVTSVTDEMISIKPANPEEPKVSAAIDADSRVYRRTKTGLVLDLASGHKSTDLKTSVHVLCIQNAQSGGLVLHAMYEVA